MLRIPYGHLLARKRLEILLHDRLLELEPQVLVDPHVHHRPRHVIVVVREVNQRFGHHGFFGPQQLIEGLEFRQAFGGDFAGPIVGSGHAQGPRGDQGRNVNVALPDAKVTGILAGAAALHGRADHHRREGHSRPRIDRTKDERLRAAAAGPGNRDPLGVHVRQARQPVQSPDRIVRLQSHHVLQPGLGLGAEIAPTLRAAHVRPKAGTMRQLDAIGIPHHVIMEDHAAHAGKLHAAGLKRVAAPFLEPLGPLDDRPADGLAVLLVEPAIGPVPMRAKHAGQFARLSLGPIQIARHKVPGKALQNHLLHRVIAAIDPPMHDRTVRRLGGHGPQPQSYQHLAPDALRPARPFLLRGRRVERKVAVEALERPQPAVKGQKPRGQHPRSGHGCRPKPQRRLQGRLALCGVQSEHDTHDSQGAAHARRHPRRIHGRLPSKASTVWGNCPRLL